MPKEGLTVFLDCVFKVSSKLTKGSKHILVDFTSERLDLGGFGVLGSNFINS